VVPSWPSVRRSHCKRPWRRSVSARAARRDEARYASRQHTCGAAPRAWIRCDQHQACRHSLGRPRANHYIITKYEDGQHNIGFHSDKAKDIDPESLITVVKTGSHGRPFELCFPGQEKSPFFSRVLAPGTAVIMTVKANLLTKHGVPVVEESGPSGSIVFRTIKTLVPLDKASKELRKRARDE